MSEKKLMPGMHVRIPKHATDHSMTVSKNKTYEVLDVEKLHINTYFHIIDDTGNKVLCILDRCGILYNNSWEIVNNSLLMDLDNIVASRAYQAALYFFCGVGVGYLIFVVLS